MGDNELNGTPEGVTPDGVKQQEAAGQQQTAEQYGQQNQQYAGQYGQQNQQYAGQYGQQNQQQYTGQYGQQNQQYAGQYGQQNQQYAGQYGQQNQQYGQQNQQYAGQYGQQNQQYGQQNQQYGQQNQQYAGQYGQQNQQYGQQNQQNQQYAGQYGQQDQQYQPAGEQTTYDQTVNMYGDQAHKPESPKKRKGIKIAIISVVAALVVIAVLVVVYMVFLRKTPKEVVEDAMENTAKELENGNISGVVGADDLDIDNLEFNSQWTIDGMSGAEQISGTQLEFNGCTAFGDSKDFKIDGSMTAAGEKATAEILSVGNKIYFSSPELLTKTLVLDANTIMSELGDTEAGEGGTLDAEALTKILDEKLDPAIDTFKESMVYEKVGKEEFKDANGKSVSAEHYTVTITTDSIDKLTNAIVDGLNDYIDSNMSDDMLSDMGVSSDQLKQTMGTIPSVIGAVFTKDIVTDVYISGGKVVHIDSEYDIAAVGVTLDLTLDLMGDGDVTSDSRIVVKLAYGSQMNVTFDGAYKAKNSSDKIDTTFDYTLSADANGETQDITGSTTLTYDEKSGAIEGSNNITADSKKVEFTYSAVLADVKKGESFSLNDIKAAFNVAGEDVISMSGSMSLAEKKNDLSAPSDSDVVDYSVLQGEDAEKYINKESAEKIITAWNGLFESADAGLSLDDPLNGLNGDDKDVTDPDDEATTEATTEDTTEKSGKNTTEASEADPDYSKEVMEIGDKTVKVNDPKGYERSYASSYSISLSDTKGSSYVIYSANEYADAAAYLKALKDNYKDLEDDNTKIDSLSDSKVKAKDGTEVLCLEADMISYDMKSTEIAFIYPMGDGSISCSISYWDAPDKIDTQKLCDTFIGAMEIK